MIRGIERNILRPFPSLTGRKVGFCKVDWPLQYVALYLVNETSDNFHPIDILVPKEQFDIMLLNIIRAFWFDFDAHRGGHFEEEKKPPPSIIKILKNL